jgi:hypothetical protein
MIGEWTGFDATFADVDPASYSLSSMFVPM